MNAPKATLSVKSPWLIGFGLVAVVQLAFIALGVPLAGLVTWLLAPLLAIWVWREGGPRLLLLALMFFWAGDVFGNPRLIGLGPIGLFISVAAFVVANILLIIVFIRHIRSASRPTAIGEHQRRWASVAVLYIVAAAVALAYTWNNLDPALAAVGAVYLLLVVVTATTAFVADIYAGIGAALLVASRLLVVLEVAGRLDGTATIYRLTVLALYTLGILLIAIGMTNREHLTNR